MPDVRENERLWSTYDWGERGDEWSGAWRSPDYQWWGTLYPRLRHYLPARTILEIAPGFGRWTHYLLGHCDRLIGIDLMAECVEACTERFRDEPKASFHQNDGRSLDAVPDGEVDLAFSMDSLVHCERDVIEAYVEELARKLAPDGVAFVHHSNLGFYRDAETGDLPFPNPQGRGVTVSGRLFDVLCRQAGLACIVQELISWGTDEVVIDCISVATRPGSRFDHERRVWRNEEFMNEARTARFLARFYGPGPPPDAKHRRRGGAAS